jgi:hypothetical protein
VAPSSGTASTPRHSSGWRTRIDRKVGAKQRKVGAEQREYRRGAGICDQRVRPCCSAAARSTPQLPGPATTTGFGGAREDCSTRSEASFPGAFTDARNLVVGPLVLIGGTYTDALTVYEYDGNKSLPWSKLDTS